MYLRNRIFLFLKLATKPDIAIRALRVAIIVGIVLNLINNTELFTNLRTVVLDPVRILLTFAVPYLVSTYSSVISSGSVKPGNVSRIDSILKCRSCNTTDFHINVGQQVDECPTCGPKTKWGIKKIFSVPRDNSDLLKSLALFARHNPQPLLRTDEKGVIKGANPATVELLGEQEITGINLYDLLPQIHPFCLKSMADTGDTKELIIEHNSRHYNLLFKGVPELKNIHIYSSDITGIVLAEKKISAQAKSISDSIEYASLIQKGMLPSEKSIESYFPDSAILYLPKDVVSGDFYWVNSINGRRIFIVSDCTGHGVPGAFMSMMGISLLDEIIMREGVSDPAEILNSLRNRLISALTRGKTENGLLDGMDISVVAADDRTNTLYYAGAYNDIYIQRESELHILKSDRMPVGKHINDTDLFTLGTFEYMKSDRLYMFTDGYRDQMGGERDKKFSSRRFREVLSETATETVKEQVHRLKQHFLEWKGDNEQIDDVLVAAIKL
ncbi:MAG: SpoIIE family protein phosphatase [Bacteroidales bacterium]|nr:SpoIIE family protein phosphatase [Bacteroidales bacterium]